MRHALFLLLLAWLGLSRVAGAQDLPAQPGSAAESTSQTASASAPAPSAGSQAAAQASVNETYRVGPGDTLQIRVYDEKDLTGEFPVNDRGQLEYPLLGTLPVGGLSPNEVAQALHAALSDGYLVEPNVTVWLDDYQSRPIQVLGAVAKPGQYFLRGPTTVLQALSLAGGVKAEGVDTVHVTRAASQGQAEELSYDRLLRQGEGNETLSEGRHRLRAREPGHRHGAGQQARPGALP